MPGSSNYNSEYDVQDEQFDPEGKGYDYSGAKEVGMRPTAGHWGSIGKNGLMLKGKKHKTWDLAVKAERDRNYKIIKRGKRYHSVPRHEETEY